MSRRISSFHFQVACQRDALSNIIGLLLMSDVAEYLFRVPLKGLTVKATIPCRISADLVGCCCIYSSLEEAIQFSG
jgi:hypothetical protein